MCWRFLANESDDPTLAAANHRQQLSSKTISSVSVAPISDVSTGFPASGNRKFWKGGVGGEGLADDTDGGNPDSNFPTSIFDKQPDFLVTAPQIDVKIPCYCFKVAKNGIAERDHLHMTKAEYRPILSQSEPGRDER
ncbi:hypothetical protein TWF173_009510 [Orbilia oligospora]|nr:hypothetical protein TWF173_009510 [Orbilia oligospora]